MPDTAPTISRSKSHSSRQMYNLENHIYEETHALLESTDKEWLEMTSNLPSSGNLSVEIIPELKPVTEEEQPSRPFKSSSNVLKRSFLLMQPTGSEFQPVPLEKFTPA